VDLPKPAEYEQGSSSEPINREKGHKRRDKFPGQGTSRKNSRNFAIEFEILLIDNWCVNGYEVTTGHLLEEL
jgi:hypothetical protein